MTSTLKARDGQYGYLKVEKTGTWKKIRLATSECVGEITVPDAGPKHIGPGYFQSSAHKDTANARWWEEHKDDQYAEYGVGSKHKHTKEKESSYAHNFCSHTGKDAVWSADGREFYCAGFGGVRPAEYALVLDLANQVNKWWWSPDAILPGSLSAYLPLNAFIAVDPKSNTCQGKAYIAPPVHANVVHFNWPDMGVIRASVEFWEELWAKLPGASPAGVPSKILISCFGSHGRTGTCLAALMMASGEVDSSLEAVLTVRAKHCEQAIEHTKQLIYLDALAADWEIGGDALSANKIKIGGSQEALTKLLHEQQVAAKKL